MSVPDREWMLSTFKQALQILAAPPDEQIRHFPDFVCVTDELALDFDHWRVVFISNFGAEATSDQLASLAAIDEEFDFLSRGGSEFAEDFWTDEALRASARWEEIRQLAVQALTTFGFPLNIPANNFNDYVIGSSIKPD
jgi:hypothetical protein